METKEKIPCYLCEELIEERLVAYNGSDRNICRDCQDDYTFSCDDCCERYHIDDSCFVQGQDRTVCRDCIGEYSCCDDCGDYYSNEDVEYDDDTGSSYCSGCTSRSNRPAYREIGFNKAKEVYDTSRLRGEIIKSPRRFGVEFEIVPKKDYEKSKLERKFLFNNNFDCWGIHSDGSLNAGGIEVVTPPMRLKRGEDDLALFTKQATKLGWTIDDSCGTHVHLDAPEFKNDTRLLRRLVLSYILLEDSILRMLPKKRRSNGYCSPLNKKNAVLGKAHSSSTIGYSLADFLSANSISKIKNLIYKTKTPEELRQQMSEHYSDNRYYGINFHSLWNRNYNTVEIRYHQGTLNELEILPWIAFHQHVLDNARKIDDKKALMLRAIKNPIERLTAYALDTNMDKQILDQMISRIKKYK